MAESYEAIPIAHGETVIIPSLEKPAILNLAAQNRLVILPELGSPAPQLQDYKIFNMLNVTEGGGNISPEVYAQRAREYDRLAIQQGIISPDVILLGHNQTVTLGRNLMPQLRLGALVSRRHIDIEAHENGLTFRDLNSKNASELMIASLDAAKIERTHPEIVDDELRDDLHRALQALPHSVHSGAISSTDLRVHARQVAKDNVFELYIEKAADYKQIGPDHGYSSRKYVIDLAQSGVQVIDSMPDASVTMQPGVTRANKTSQLTIMQARELLRLAHALIQL